MMKYRKCEESMEMCGKYWKYEVSIGNRRHKWEILGKYEKY